MNRVFTKREVRLWLNIMSDDATRPALSAVAFSKKHLVMTNGYYMVAIDIHDDWKKSYEDTGSYEDYLIKRSAIEQWVKTHSAKDLLTVSELAKMEREDGQYPDWEKLMTDESITKPDDVAPMFNAQYLRLITDLFSNMYVKVETYNSRKPMRLTTSLDDKALIMPVVKG